MTRTIFALALCVFIVLGRPALSQTLPLEVQIDMAILALEESIIAQDSADILARIDALRELDPSSGDGELLFFEAEAAFAQNDLARAEPALVRFLSEVGASSVNYQAALKLMLDVPKKQAEAAEAERKAEEAERQAEEARNAAEVRERARQAEMESARLRAEREAKLKADQAAKVRAEQAFVAGEKSLRLTADEIRHIRFVLQAKYGDAWSPPSNSPDFTSEDRRYISDYYRERGIARTGVGGNYLSVSVAGELLETNFTPRRYPNGLYGAYQTQPVNLGGDWINYRTEQPARCQMESEASDWSRNEIFVHPVMNFSVLTSGTGSSMALDMVSLNPFRAGDPVYAMVDNIRYDLQIDDGFVKPLSIPGTNSLNNDVIRAIRASKESIRIYGTGALSGQTLSLGFSGWGFTAAFRKMMEDCNRPGLATWIE